MKYCKKCGSPVNTYSSYCNTCGTYLKAMNDGLNVEKDEKQYCVKCGTKISKKYCMQCGTYGSTTKLVYQDNNLGKILNTIGKQTQKKVENIQNSNWNFEIFKKKDTKDLLFNAGIFSVVMMVLSLVFVFCINAVFIGASTKIIQKSNMLAIGELKQLKSILDFKGIVWSLLYGLKDNMGIWMKGSALFEAGMQLPFILLPFTVIFMIIAEAIRKAIMKTQRNLILVIGEAFGNSIAASIITLVFCTNKSLSTLNSSAAEMISDVFSSYLPDGAINISLKSGAAVFQTFLTVFLMTLVLQVILPGFISENKLYNDIRAIINKIILFIICVAGIPAMIFSIVVKIKVIPQVSIIQLLIIFIMAIGMFAVCIISGNVSCFQIIAANMDSDFGELKVSSGLTSIKYIQDYIETSGTTPFWILNIVLGLLFLAVVFYITLSFWKNYNLDIVKSLILSAAVGGIIAGFVVMLGKMSNVMFAVKTNMEFYDSYSNPQQMSISMGHNGSVPCFVKVLLVVFVISAMSYFLYNYKGNFAEKLFKINSKPFVIVMIAVTLIVSALNISTITVKSWKPVITAIGSEYDSDFEADKAVYELREKLTDLKNMNSMGELILYPLRSVFFNLF